MAAGEPVSIIDGALEGFLWLSSLEAKDPSDRQAARVRRNKSRILTFDSEIRSLDRYKKRISDIKLLASTAKTPGSDIIRITPADFDSDDLSPLKSSDLIYSWKHPGENIFYPWFSKRIGDELIEKNHTHVGISIGFLSQALTALALCGWIKKKHPHIKIILGGSLINSWMKGPSQMNFLYPLVDKIHHGGGEKEIVQFAGRVYRGQGIPDFLDLYDRGVSENYLSPGRILPYSAAMGCSWRRCTFCSETYEQYPYCEKQPSLVIKQLKTLTEKYKPALIHLCDSEISPELIDQLIQNPPGAAWYGFSRFLPAMTDPDYCRRLADSGCSMLGLGLESGDQEVLNILKKGIRLEIVSKVLKNLREAGILTFVYIMFGTPVENKISALKTRDFIGEHSEFISFLNVSIFNMPISSDESGLVDSMNFYEGDLAIYRNFHHPQGWSRAMIRQFIEKDFRKIPSLREILKRTPPVFTSSHAPFMHKLLNK